MTWDQDMIAMGDKWEPSDAMVWEDPEMQEWNATAQSGDFIGTILNNPCQQICNISDCEFGNYCTITDCLEPCTNTVTCTQDIMFDDWEWHSVNCTNGTYFSPDSEYCVAECEYEDCQESSEHPICWKETCNDGCGNKNCSIWYSENDQWYGEECDSGSMMGDFRLQDIFVGISETVQAYDDTLRTAASYCPDEQCKEGADEFINTWNGEFGAPDKVPGTAEMSKNATGAIAMGAQTVAMMAAQLKNSISNYTDQLFADGPVHDIFAAAANDTVSIYKEDNDGSALNILENTDSTDEALMVGQNMAPMLLEEIKPNAEENPVLYDFWGMMTTAFGAAFAGGQ